MNLLFIRNLSYMCNLVFRTVFDGNIPSQYAFTIFLSMTAN